MYVHIIISNILKILPIVLEIMPHMYSVQHTIAVVCRMWEAKVQLQYSNQCTGTISMSVLSGAETGSGMSLRR